MHTGLEQLVEKLARAGTMPATPAAIHGAPPPTHFAPQPGAQSVAGFHPDAVARMVQSHPDAQARLRSYGYGTSPGSAPSLGASAAQGTQAARSRYLGPEAAANALREHSEVQAGNKVVVSDPAMNADAVRGERRRPPAATSGTSEAPPTPPARPSAPQAGAPGRSSMWRYALPGAAVAAGLGAAALAGNREDDKYRNLVYAPAPYG